MQDEPGLEGEDHVDRAPVGGQTHVVSRGGPPSWADPGLEDSKGQQVRGYAGEQGTRSVYSGWKEKDFVSVVGSEALKEEDEDCPCPLRTTGNRLVQEEQAAHSVGNRATRRGE
jgi:hypothetical protein